MYYKHHLLPIGGIKSNDQKIKFLFYREPVGHKVRSITTAHDIVNKSSYALAMDLDYARKDFEQNLNQVQMELDETYMSQTIVSLGD